MDNIEQYNKTGYIAAIARGHNAGVCLLKDGEVVFSIEEERLSRRKYDGGPYASMVEILKYTDKIDYLVIAHTQSLKDPSTGRVDYSGDDVYTGMARKLGLIDQHIHKTEHPQVIDLSHIHHKLHAACAFYRSGFDKAVAVIVDGAGTFIPIKNSVAGDMTVFEVESIFSCDYPNDIYALYKHYGTGTASPGGYYPVMDSESISEPGKTHEALFTDKAGITKTYEAVTQYCGFSAIEAGKTMGLSPYGKACDKFPKIYTDGGGGKWRTSMLVSGLITFIAAVHYWYMREYYIETGTSPTFFRYVDWILTVPLMCVEFYLILKAAGATKSLMWKMIGLSTVCLLYTSDAADE